MQHLWQITCRGGRFCGTADAIFYITKFDTFLTSASNRARNLQPTQSFQLEKG